MVLVFWNFGDAPRKKIIGCSMPTNHKNVLSWAWITGDGGQIWAIMRLPATVNVKMHERGIMQKSFIEFDYLLLDIRER